MCGITGIVHFDRLQSLDEQKLKRMTDVIEHRGPDSEGFYVDNHIGLGHRRLSIIDLQTGNQPMFSEDQKKVIVFNGEIYNYIEIREELIKKGYRFQSESDTEVILNAYEEWGYECQNKFNGMWAFALWDQTKQVLFLSRDRIGEKPIHYSIFENTFVFGSEMKSLFTYGIPKIADFSLTELYLMLAYIPEPYTFYKNIFKLKAGHYLIVKNQKVEEFKYWDLPEIDESNMLKDKDYIYEQFESLFKDSIKIRMRSNVPYGAFLSGGLDSSSIVSVMSGISEFPINTFTIGFPQKDFDESLLASDVAKKFHTSHHLGEINPDDFDTIINKIAFHYDEPFGDSSAIPTGYVSKFAREKVKMVLTGDGGDEVLSGYNSYVGIKIASLYQKFPHLIQNNLPRIVSILKHQTKGQLRLKMNKIDSVLNTSRLPFEERMIQKRANTDYLSIKKMTSKMEEIYPIEDFISDIMKKCSFKDEFYKLMYLNFKYDLPNGYLVKVDRMSMAYSLETRTPFLDYRLIEFMTGVDKNVKMQGWERKSILRNTIGRTLPDTLLNAPKKGFGIPLREWFKSGHFEDKINNNLKAAKSILDQETIELIVNENKEGLKDHGSFVWTLMMLNKMIK